MEALWRTGSRPCIFFMDGFNEVKPDCQEACALALQEFMHPGIYRYVVTSRLNAQIAGLPAQVADTVTLDIVQLDEYQIRDFLIRHGAAGLYDQMDYGLKGLARNPFLLWVMAQSCAGLATKDLPRNRGQLYCNLIDHYIFAEREQKKIPPTTQYNFLLVKKPILSRLAFGMKQEGITRRLEDLTLLHTVRAQLHEIRTQYDGLMPIRPHELMPDPPIAKAILDEIVTMCWGEWATRSSSCTNLCKTPLPPRTSVPSGLTTSKFVSACGMTLGTRPSCSWRVCWMRPGR